MIETLNETFIPELTLERRGKVRDVYRKDDNLLLVTSDRISCFDVVLSESIPYKGGVLNGLASFWLERTRDIVPNHFLSQPDPNVMVVKRCQPLPVEVIVRRYVCGSLWRAYATGAREKCGVKLPEGLQENGRLAEPIVTPTTKAEVGHDEDISAEEIVRTGLVEKEKWEQIERVALELFARGEQIAQQRGLVLVDTKYEFGLDEKGELVLIDEVHTPDSSRFWFATDQARGQVRFPDKEQVRQWLTSRSYRGEGSPPALPAEVIEEASRGYRSIYEQVVGTSFEAQKGSVRRRILERLRAEGWIKGGFALVIAGSESDRPHFAKIAAGLEEQGIPYEVVVGSAHKEPKRVLELLDRYNASLEPVVCITVAGRSNALSGVAAANLDWPVIACPPFKDKSDYLVNIHSSLQMPSCVPALTVLEPSNAALAAQKILKCSLT